MQTFNNKQQFSNKRHLTLQLWKNPCVRLSSTFTQAEVEVRVLEVCKVFDKIVADRVALTSHFINDLGLDSLDHVEVIMAIEDEFGFEIPDEQAEKLITPEHIVKFVMSQGDQIKV